MKASHFPLLLLWLSTAQAQQYPDTAARTDVHTTNDPRQSKHFAIAGSAWFIHWGLDSMLGGVISHSLVGASPDFQDRFFRLLRG
jgi:alpha-L-fucosidase